MPGRSIQKRSQTGATALLKDYEFTPTVRGKPLTVESLETARVAPRWGVLKLVASNGITGYGEFSYEGQTIESLQQVKRLKAFIDDHKLDLRNPNRIIESIRAYKFYNRDGSLWSAAAGIEMACWDIIGKELKRPLYALLGGAVRDRLRVYHWAGGNFNDGDPVEPAVNEVKSLVNKGLKAVKLNACPPMHDLDISSGIQQAVERVQAIREAVGPKVLLALDFHGRVAPANAIQLANALAPYDPFFIEEPVRPEHNHFLPRLAAATNLRIATGERMFEPEQFASVLAEKSVQIVQPDLVHVGGILRTLKIAHLAECFGASIAPHCPLGPLAFMACAHLMFASRNGVIQECSSGIHYNSSGVKNNANPFLDYLTDPQPLKLDKDGCLPIPHGFGLGVELDWSKIKKAPKERWKELGSAGFDGTPLTW